MIYASRCHYYGAPCCKNCCPAVKRYQTTNDVLAEWLEQHTVTSPDGSVPQADLQAAYESHYRQSCRRPPSKQMLGRRLRELLRHIELGQRSFAGRRAWVYAGISIREGTGE